MELAKCRLLVCLSTELECVKSPSLRVRYRRVWSRSSDRSRGRRCFHVSHAVGGGMIGCGCATTGPEFPAIVASEPTSATSITMCPVTPCRSCRPVNEDRHLPGLSVRPIRRYHNVQGKAGFWRFDSEMTVIIFLI